MKNFYDTIRGFIGHIIVIMIVLATPIASSAELYKYRNEDGVTVLNSYIPARYVKNGYTILSLNGRVLEVIPRALTDKEIRIRDSALQATQKREREEREQKIADQNLLRLYSTPEDVTRARDTKLTSIDSFISTQEGNIRRLQNQKRQLESSLADVERAGGTINKDRVDRIRSIEGRIKQIVAEIRDKEEEKIVMTTSYAADLKRVLELYGNDSSS
jgi:hypothetical protein